MSNQNVSPIIFGQYTQKGILSLTYKYIPLHISDEISRIVASYKKKEISLEEAYNQGRTFIEANISEIKVLPVSFVVPAGDSERVKFFDSVKDRKMRQKMLQEDQSLMALIQNFVLSRREEQCNKSLREYVVSVWKRWVQIEIIRIAHDEPTLTLPNIFDLDCENILKRSQVENNKEDNDFFTLRDYTKRNLQEFYIRVAELERKNLLRGQAVFSKTVIVLKREVQSYEPNKKIKSE
jgi:hypothetical protein